MPKVMKKRSNFRTTVKFATLALAYGTILMVAVLVTSLVTLVTFA